MSDRSARRCSLVRVLVCLAVWAVAGAMALVVAAETSVGPVVFDLSKNHGVHAGDMVAVLVGAAIATVASVVILAPCLKAVWRGPDESDEQAPTDGSPPDSGAASPAGPLPRR